MNSTGTTTTDINGNFLFSNVPFNPYHLTVNLPGFNTYSQDVGPCDRRWCQTWKIVLNLAGASSTVTVEASGVGLGRNRIDLPHRRGPRTVRQASSSRVPRRRVSSLSRYASSTPGVAADSNGLFHGLGDHASNSFSVDGQAITDQQSSRSSQTKFPKTRFNPWK